VGGWAAGWLGGWVAGWGGAGAGRNVRPGGRDALGRSPDAGGGQGAGRRLQCLHPFFAAPPPSRPSKAHPDLAENDFFVTGESYAVSRVAPPASSPLLRSRGPPATACARPLAPLTTAPFPAAPPHLPQGHYAPAVANRVYKAKELGQGDPINIKGVAIGNGLTVPAIQFGA
jgi:hypothetical protein